MTGPINRRRHPSAKPVATPWDDPRLDEGLALFNEGQHWHAHESWEPLWMGLEEDDKVFVQGLIMAAAMLHQHGRRVPLGVRNHWLNVQARLEPHRPATWGIDVEGLLMQLRRYADDAERREWALDPKAVRIVRRNGPAKPKS
jgi:predicted metal-dependent hydrolase